MLSLGLSLLGIGKNLLSWLKSGIAWIFADIHRIAIAVLLGCCIFLYVGKQAETRRADKQTAVAAKWESAYNWMVVASEENREAQIALNKAVTDKQTDIARLTDENETNRVLYASRADDYARRMSAKSYCERQASPPAQSDIAKSGDRPGDDSVILSRADFAILNNNTARLTDVKAWGDRLMIEGLAEKLGDVNTEEEVIP